MLLQYQWFVPQMQHLLYDMLSSPVSLHAYSGQRCFLLSRLPHSSQYNLNKVYFLFSPKPHYIQDAKRQKFFCNTLNNFYHFEISLKYHKILMVIQPHKLKNTILCLFPKQFSQHLGVSTCQRELCISTFFPVSGVQFVIPFLLKIPCQQQWFYLYKILPNVTQLLSKNVFPK